MYNHVDESKIGIEYLQNNFQNIPQEQYGPSNKRFANPWLNPKLLSDHPMPLYFRTVSTVLPVSAEVCKIAGIPFGLVITPANVANAPIQDCTKINTVRCPRCNAYLCPWCKVITNNKWKCALCGYTSIMTTGVSFEERKEMKTPVIDLIAPKTYVTHPMAGPSFMFVFDISYDAISTNFVQSAAASVLSSLDSIDDDTYISFALVDHQLTLFDFVRNKRIVISDFEDEVKVSISKCKLLDCKSKLISVLQEIINISPNKSSIGHCLGEVFNEIPNILDEIGGVVMIFCSGAPRIGPHSAPSRANSNLNKEKDLLRMPPEQKSFFYKDIASIIAHKSISVYLFVSCPGFADLAVIGVPSGLTSGKVYSFPNYSQDMQGSLHSTIYKTMSTNYLWDSTLMLRMGPGVSIVRTIANSLTGDRNIVIVPILSPEDSITFDLKIDPHVTTDNVVFQFSLVWTNEKRQRMIRVFTFSLPVSMDPQVISENVDEISLLSLLTKRAITKHLTDGAVSACASFVKEAKQIIKLNKNFQSFPQLAFGVLKSPFLMEKHPQGADGRIELIINIRNMGIIDLLLYAYPRLLKADGTLLPLTRESLDGLLILHSNDKILLWNSELEGQVSIDQIANDQIVDTIKSCWKLSGRFLPVFAVKSLENYLVEDALETNLSFTDWMTSSKAHSY